MHSAEKWCTTVLQYVSAQGAAQKLLINTNVLSGLKSMTGVTVGRSQGGLPPVMVAAVTAGTSNWFHK